MVDPKQLADAVWSGDRAMVDALLVAGADPNLAEEDRWPPIHLAIEVGHKEIIRRLIAAGADINRALEKGFTPLAHAIDVESDVAWQRFCEPNRASTELTELLLDAGAIPSSEAFRLAQDYGNRRALDALHRRQRDSTKDGAE